MSSNLYITPCSGSFDVARIRGWLDARPDAFEAKENVYQIADSPIAADMLYADWLNNESSNGTYVRIEPGEILVENEGGALSQRSGLEFVKWLASEYEVQFRSGWSGEQDITDAVRTRGVEQQYDEHVRSAELRWTNQLREIGFFHYLSYGNDTSVSTAQARRDVPVPDEDALVAYLESGHIYRALDTLATDDVGDVLGPVELLTDGLYIWPSLLAKQVRQDHVRLPRHFMIHARSNGWRVPPVDLASLPGSANIPPLTRAEVEWYTRPVIRSSVEADACSLFVARGLAITGTRLRSGAADAVYRGYTDSGTRVLVTFTMRHDESYDELTERLRFAHERIAPLLYLGRSEAGRGFIDELVEMEPVGRSIIESAPLSEAAAIRVGIDVAAVLETFHEQSVVLGGLSPEVIYVDDALRFTQLTPRSRRFVATVDLQSGGPTSYGLPYSGYEALVLGRGSDERGDIFALCASLFHAVTGKHPFGGSLPEIFQRIATKQPMPFTGSPAFLAVLVQGLDADPNRRPTASELGVALSRLTWLSA